MIKMIKRLERLKNTVNKYMADIRPDWPKTCQSERKSVVSRRPSILSYNMREENGIQWNLKKVSGLVQPPALTENVRQVKYYTEQKFTRHA
jgi:hypothetical protein